MIGLTWGDRQCKPIKIPLRLFTDIETWGCHSYVKEIVSVSTAV